jgi:hypothetical protein
MEVDEVLKIYNFNFFEDFNMINFIKSVINKSRNMIITTPNKNKFNNKEICDSLNNRIPVYIGKPIKYLYNYPSPRKEQYFGIKYAVCGKAYLLDGGSFYAIHTWGVNLESNETLDYKNIVNNNKINVKKYREETNKMIECIIKSKNYYKLSNVYLPMIGLGFYLSSISLSETKKAFQIFFDEISKTDLIVVINNINEIDNNIFKKYKKNIEIGNLFIPRNGKYGIVNAWDSNSFIGNGGSLDNSIDGWFVAGFGPNQKLKNSSFLHNTMFNKNICNKII